MKYATSCSCETLCIIAPEKLEKHKHINMTSITKKTITTFLISGLTYAGLGAGFDYSDGIGFSFWKFIIKASFFGLLMALMFRYNFKKNDSTKDNK